MKTPEKHLYYLSELSDYKIAGGYPDVRNWEVKDEALRKIGTVNNLLVNKKTERVVYLDIEVDQTIIAADHDPYGRPANSEIREFINEKGENHIIIPIGLVDLNHEQEYVFAESIDHKTFAETKRIRKDTVIEREYENAILDSYGRRHTPVDKRMDNDIENAEVYKEERKDPIKQRHNLGEYRDSETPSKNLEDEAEQYFDENDSAKTRERLLKDKDEEFNGRSEFDDSRFYRGKK